MLRHIKAAAAPKIDVFLGEMLHALQYIQPLRGAGVAGHTEIPAGRKGKRADLRTVGQAGTLELLGKKS